MTLWERFVEVNRPGPPEHSVSFRTASVMAVLIGIGACWSEGELSLAVSLFAVVATVLGNIVSYRHRGNPWPGVKPILALCAVGGFVWFILTVTRTASPGDIATVEAPLAVLFAWVLSTHAFDVPSRRDVTYSLAGSTALIAVAASQSVDLDLGVWVLAWVVCGAWGLVAMWQSVSETDGVPWRPLMAAGAVVGAAALGLVAVLPAPNVSTALAFTSSSPNSQPVSTPTNLTDGKGALPAHAADAAGRTGIGGFLGFAKSLDTANRISLGDQVIMRVRASRPNYWVGQTFDSWNGRSWIQTANPLGGRGVERVIGGSPFVISTQLDQMAGLASGAQDIQTFYLADGGPNLVFHADNAQRIYLQAKAVLVTLDGTIASTSTMGPGTIYTVVSNDSAATSNQLRAATASGSPSTTANREGFATYERTRYLQLPRTDPRITALAQSITEGVGGAPRAATYDPHTYDKVQAIGHWMATHVRYTTDIPPLQAGADAVDSFLFGSRRGYCEQISTATVVMLRSLGIPAREAVGYVPGPYNPITDLYDIQAKDAHAWVQVWFPGFGWQNFDPTATVPLANPTPGSVLAKSFGHALGRVPWIPILAVTGAVGVVVWTRRRHARQPVTWTHKVAADLARGGARLDRSRRTHETLSDYGRRLMDVVPDQANDLHAVIALVERSTYGGIEPSAEEIAWALSVSHRFRGVSKRRGRGPSGRSGGTVGAPASAPQEDQAREWANASSNEAPAANSGR